MPTFIPQTPEQARQRDHQAGLDTGLPENAAHELAKLRNAIRLHRDAKRRGVSDDPDEALWAHVPEQA